MVKNAVTIDKNEIRRCRLCHRFVDDDRLAEAVVLVPHMLNRMRQGVHVALDDLANLRAGAIVGDNDLEIAEGLVQQTKKYLFEEIVALVDGDDELHGGTWARCHRSVSMGPSDDFSTVWLGRVMSAGCMVISRSFAHFRNT